MVSVPAGLLEDRCPRTGCAVASASGSRMEQPQLWRPTAIPSIFWHSVASGYISLVV